MQEIRKNIINWYPFKGTETILQLGVSSGKITEELCNKAKRVVAVVNSEEQDSSLKEELKEYQNLEIVICKNIEDVHFEEKFDYIALIGTLEQYCGEEKANKVLSKIISKIKNNLDDNGKILLALDNRFGMKYWTSVYAQKNILCNKKHTVSKKQIEEILDKEGLQSRKYYYPLPDYKFTNVIFTDNYLPNRNSVSRNFTYAEDEFVSFNQTESYQEILKEDKDLFDFFATSYFIEIAKNEFEDNKIRFVTFTNIRKDKYRIKTTMYEDKVTKEAVGKEANAHIEQIKHNIDIMKDKNINTLDSYDGNKIISKYVTDGKSYDEVLLEELKNNEHNKFFEEIEKYKSKLINSLQKVDVMEQKTVFEKYEIPYEKEDIEGLTFVKYGLWDLIFQNTFVINNELYFYDQEWYDENIPVEYIMYRAIAYFGEAHNYIPREEIFQKMNLAKYLNLFGELDNKVQEEIRDEEMWNSHCKVKTGQTLVDLYKNLQNEFEEYKKEKNDKIQADEQQIEQLKKDLAELEEKYKQELAERERIYNSTSWKITKPVRFIGKYVK